MVKLVLKLALAGLLANAFYQVVPAFYTKWKFQDALREMASFSQKRSVDDILDRSAFIARDHGLALDRTDFTVQQRPGITIIDTSYVVDMRYIPTRPHLYTFIVHAQGDPPRFGSLTP